MLLKVTHLEIIKYKKIKNYALKMMNLIKARINTKHNTKKKPTAEIQFRNHRSGSKTLL